MNPIDELTSILSPPRDLGLPAKEESELLSLSLEERVKEMETQIMLLQTQVEQIDRVNQGYLKIILKYMNVNDVDIEWIKSSLLQQKSAKKYE